MFGFQFAFSNFHPLYCMINNCNIVVPHVLLQYCDTPGVVFKEEQRCIAQIPPDLIKYRLIPEQ